MDKNNQDRLKSWLIVGLVVIAIAALVIGVAYFYNSREYVGEVAGEKISKHEFIFFLSSVRNTLEESMSNTDGESKEAFWNSTIEGKKATEVAEDIAFDEVKKFKIQLIKAEEENIELDKEEIENNKEEIKSMIEMLGGKNAANERIMAVYGINLNEYNKIREKMMVLRKYMEMEEAKITVEEQEISDSYFTNFENENVVTVCHILLTTRDAQNNPVSDEQVEVIKKKAEDILLKVQNGEDFTKLVSEYSEDTVSKSTGGQYTFTKGKMAAEFEQWSFNAKPGDVGLVRADYGFHIIKKPLFDEIKDKVKKTILEQKYGIMVEEWKSLPEYDLTINQKALEMVRTMI